MMNRPKKIISGGQNGADYAGLVAAQKLGIPTGGTAPKGWRVRNKDGSEGSNPALANFGLVEHTSSAYPPRTAKNVADSDGTVLFGDLTSRGSKLTAAACKKQFKPLITNPTAVELRAFVGRHRVETLNVAGNTLSEKNPLIYLHTYKVICEAFSQTQKSSKTLGDWQADAKEIRSVVTELLPSMNPDEFQDEFEECINWQNLYVQEVLLCLEALDDSNHYDFEVVIAEASESCHLLQMAIARHLEAKGFDVFVRAQW